MAQIYLEIPERTTPLSTQQNFRIIQVGVPCLEDKDRALRVLDEARCHGQSRSLYSELMRFVGGKC